MEMDTKRDRMPARSWFELELINARTDEVIERIVKNTLENKGKYVAAHMYSRHTIDASTWLTIFGAGYSPTHRIDPDKYWTKPVAMSVKVGAVETITRVHERGIMSGVDSNIAYFRSLFGANQAIGAIDTIQIGTGDETRVEYFDSIGAGPASPLVTAEDYAEIECLLFDNGGVAGNRYLFLERSVDYTVNNDDPSVLNEIDLDDGNGLMAGGCNLIAIYYPMPTTITSGNNRVAYVSLTDTINKTADFKLATSWYIEFDP